MLTVKKNKMKSYQFMILAAILSAGVIVTGKIAVLELGPFTILSWYFGFSTDIHSDTALPRKIW